jgi:hypothetical protein
MMTSMGSLLPGVLAAAIILGPGTDTTLTRLPGYGGVLPIPFVADDASLILSPDEIIAPRHTEGRTERGRILYANDRAPKATQVDPVRTARAKRSPCNSSLLQSRTSAQPNS